MSFLSSSSPQIVHVMPLMSWLDVEMCLEPAVL